MADEKTDRQKPLRPRQPERRRPSRRSTTPYYVAAFFAAAAMAWYLFFFVPSKLEYFVGVRSRALSVASNQVKTNVENLASALSKAPPCDLQGDGHYLKVLVPQIRINHSDLHAPGLVLKTPDSTGCQAKSSGSVSAQPTASVAWDDVMAQAAELSLAGFDDLILATQSGDVIWQREETTPRVGNLAQVFYAESPNKGWLSFNWNAPAEVPKHDAPKLPRATASKPISLEGRSVLLLVHAVPLPHEAVVVTGGVSAASGPQAKASGNDEAPPTLFVAGVVSRSALQIEAMHVPLAWVLLLSLPVILLFLALPFVKLATLTARERFSFTDAIVLLLAAFVIASIAATMPFVVTAVDDDVDRSLQAFAADLNRRLIDDVRQTVAFGQGLNTRRAEFEDGLQPCAVKVDRFPQTRCNLWAAVGDRLTVERGQLDLDVVIWLDKNGFQVDKWTTKAQLTQPTAHERFQHFRDLTVNRYWRVQGTTTPKDLPPFVLEPLRAPTTAELAVLIAFPIANAKPEAQFLALNVRLPSLLDAVTPPGYGFAVIAPDGKVMFHSDENRTLHENFFQEVGEPAAVRKMARSGHLVTWSGEYHGRPHRLHLRPLSKPLVEDHSGTPATSDERFEGSSWQIVTFQALNPILAQVTGHQSGTLRLIGINLGVLIAAAFCLVTFAKTKGRDVSDLLNVSNVTLPDRLWLLIALAVAAVIALQLTAVVSFRTSLDKFYVFFAVLPLLAIGVSVWARRQSVPEIRSIASPEVTRALVASELALLVLLVAALPAAGLTRIVSRVHQIDDAGEWLEEMQRRIAERNGRLLARVNGPAYTYSAINGRDNETRDALRTTGFASAANLKKYAYIDKIQIEDPAAATVEQGEPEAGQKVVRFLLEWNPFPSRDSTGHPPVTAGAGTFRLEPPIAGSPALVVTDRSNPRPASFDGPTDYSLPPAKLLFGTFLLCCTIAAVYWARRKLLRHPAIDAPTIDTVLRCLPERGSHGVMMIGPPRTNKDRAVREAVEARNEQTNRRIRLLETVADDEFVSRELAALDSSDPRIWIHVSNLETHLVAPDRRRLALHLLDRLLDARPHELSRTVIVTTTVDPIAHFEEIFEKEREGIYKDAIPEVELSRLSLLLTRFHRCYKSIGADETTDPWWHYRPADWKSVLAWETSTAALKYVGEDLSREWSHRASVSRAELLGAISSRSAAIYQLLWTSCTRREKLALVQLAQEGVVTPKSADVVSALMAKGIVVRRPGPAIFNHSFRRFLWTIERSEVVREWEQVDGHGLWWVAGRLVASCVLAGGLFFLLTQGYSVEALLPVLSGTGLFGVPLVRSLAARFSGTSPAPATA